MLKCSAPLPSVAISKNVLAQSGAESVYDSRTAEVQSIAQFTTVVDDSELLEVDAADVTSPSSAVVHGRLKNSEIMLEIENYFPHLTEYQRDTVVCLIKCHVSLFSDLLTHIDVRDTPPIKSPPGKS